MTPAAVEESGLRVEVRATVFACDEDGEAVFWTATALASEGLVLVEMEVARLSSVRTDPTQDIFDLYGAERAEEVGRVIGERDADAGDCVLVDVSLPHRFPDSLDLIRFTATEALRALGSGRLHVDAERGDGWVDVLAGQGSGTFERLVRDDRRALLARLLSARRGLRIVS